MTLAPCCKNSLFQKASLVFLVFVLVYTLVAARFQLVLAATPSLPYRLFVLSKRSKPSSVVPKKGSYILFYKPSVQTKVIKQVKGVPGSRVHVDAFGHLWVDDFCVGKPHDISRDGKPVQPLKAGVIPKGTVFVYAPHDRSFDSRYEDFGLVPIASILGVGVGVL